MKILSFGSKPPRLADIIGHPQVEYDQGDQVMVWYDDLYNLVCAARKLTDFLQDAVRGPESPVGIDLACSSVPLAETLSELLNALEREVTPQTPNGAEGGS